MISKTILPLFIGVALLSCKKIDSVNTEPTSKPFVEEIPVLTDLNANMLKCDTHITSASNQFGFNLLNEINKTASEVDNIFISPTSVSTIFAFCANGANGETRQEIINTLGFQDKTMEEVDEYFMHFTNSIGSLDPKATLAIANSVWPASWLSVKQAFIDAGVKYFDAQTQTLDYANSDANDIINSWVEDKTNDRIKNLLDELDLGVAMVLVNAIYFKADWSVEFDPEQTHDAQFTYADGSAGTVQMMHKNDTVRYYEDQSMQAVEMYYGDSTFSMVVMLPKETYSTDDIIAGLDDEKWTAINNAFVSAEMNVYLPRTKIEWKSELNDYLQIMGIKKAFNAADFSNITDNVRLVISQVIHQSFLEINEQGSEAAAATAIVIRYTSAGPASVFRADKPFVLAIKENTTNAVLFAGEINKP